MKTTHGLVAVAIYGPHFREIPAVAGRIFRALADAGMNILAISTSVSSVTSVFEEVSWRMRWPRCGRNSTSRGSSTGQCPAAPCPDTTVAPPPADCSFPPSLTSNACRGWGPSQVTSPVSRS